MWAENVDNKRPLDQVLHVLHTLKGSSLLVGLTDFGGVAHEIESLLESYQVNAKPYTQSMLNRLLSVTDDLSVALQDGSLREDASYYAPLMERINAEDSVIAKPVEKAASSVVTMLHKKKAAEDQQPKVVRKLKSVSTSGDRSVKISNTLLDTLIADVGEVNVSQGQLAEKNKARQLQIKELSLTIDRLRQQLRKLEIETETQVLFKVDKASEETEFDPLELDRYSEIQQLSRSLLESITDLEDIRETLQASDEEMSQLLHRESKLTDTLLEDLLRTRMVDFSKFSPRFERLVRQLSSDLGKPTTLTVLGGETEIDRFILNELQASIEHIIRNAMTHAIEEPEERAFSKKDKKADIKLHLSRQGSEIHLTISDDGRGIDTTRIRQKAISLGLINDGDQLSEDELMQYILKPGFSTVDEVSKLAGRGIGMDIVNDTIRDIGGTLKISSRVGKGASFHLIFPYTMAINMALMVEAGGATYAVPNNFIENIVRVPTSLVRENLQSDSPVLIQSDKQYVLHELSQLLGHGQSAVSSTEDRWVHVILIDSRQQRHAIVIDHLIGNKEVVVKPLGLHMGLIPWLSGSTISSTGDVTLMLDMPALVEMDVIFQQGNYVEKVAVEEQAPTIMVVDDSITFRKVATKLLLREGYQVVEARDGVEAVEKLVDTQPDAFLLDVEMPRMDGFDLANHIRNTEGISERPIVMVTSRTGDKHKNHAKEIGVNDYFGKPFNNKELVESINNLVEASHANA
jgi:chemosensory pili system protein ChpA (sensor histidine kinase/response regulator)